VKDPPDGGPSGTPATDVVGVPASGNERGRQTRTRILAAADVCFERRGLELTLDEVAAEARTTRMTVHRHTGGRERLVTHLVLRASVRLADDLHAVLDGEGPLDDRLAEASVLAVTVVRNSPALDRLFSGGDPTAPWPELDPDARLVATIHAFFLPYMREAEESGSLAVTADEAVSWLLSEILLVLTARTIAPDEAALRDRFSRFVLPAVFRPVDRPG